MFTAAFFLSFNSSVDYIETGVTLQALRNANAFGGLIIFKQCSHYARQGKSRPVERVTQVCLLVVATVAALQAVGLVALEIRY